MEIEKVIFVGIDHWNRPIFTSVKRPFSKFYGSCDHLFGDEAEESEVLAIVKDLLYFGATFGCEPLGGSCDVEIVTAKDVEAMNR